jgi:hypothetical protein
MKVDENIIVLGYTLSFFEDSVTIYLSTQLEIRYSCAYGNLLSKYH